MRRQGLQAGAALLVALLVVALLVADNLRGDPEAATGPTAASTEVSPSARPQPTASAPTVPKSSKPSKKPKPPKPTKKPRAKPGPPEPVLVEPGTGRVGSGLRVGPLEFVDAPIGPAVTGPITTSVANLPNRTGDAGFAAAMRTLTAPGPDFLMLNEVSSRSLDGLRSLAPGYDAYRDPQDDRSEGGFQAMNNVVMWQVDRWRLVDAGRVKLVEDDGSYYQGRAVVWDRFATWAMLQRDDGAIVSVVSSHMMTNPAKYPQQPGHVRQSRVARYGAGMDVLVRTLDVLAAHGPVLLGGDMNSFPTQGPWTAAAKLSSAGFGFVRDSAVMYLFFDDDVQVLDSRQAKVDSDHPALITTLDMNGLGAT